MNDYVEAVVRKIKAEIDRALISDRSVSDEEMIEALEEIECHCESAREAKQHEIEG